MRTCKQYKRRRYPLISMASVLQYYLDAPSPPYTGGLWYYIESIIYIRHMVVLCVLIIHEISIPYFCSVYCLDGIGSVHVASMLFCFLQ